MGNFNIETLRKYDLVEGENFFALEDGKYLVKRYGKYEPNLTLIVADPSDSELKPFEKGVLNTRVDGTCTAMRGEYYKSKKGTDCFRVHAGGKHTLIRASWGGAFNDSRGFRDEEFIKAAVYYRRASSNGGGTGYDYIIVPVGARREISEDDI